MNVSSQPTSGLNPTPPTAAGPNLSTPPRGSGLMNEPPLSPGPAPDPAPSPSASLEAQVVRLGLMTTAEVATTMQEEAETGRPFAELAVEAGRIAAADLARLTAPATPAAPPAPELQLAPPAPALNVVQPLVRPPAVEAAPEPQPQAAVEPEPVVKITVEPEPRADAAPPVQATTPSTKATVYVRLTSSERISAGQFDTVEAAERRARELMIAVDTPGNWPRVDGRYIKPDTIASIDVEG
jgi:hypothetical protein